MMADIEKMASPPQNGVEKAQQPTAVEVPAPAAISPSSPPSQQQSPQTLGFRYVWPVKVQLRQLGANGENTILHISPKFATAHEHISFQWTLKMHGSPETEEDDEDRKAEEAQQASTDEDEVEEESPSSAEKGYVAISLYYLDGPVSNLKLKAQVRIMGEKGTKRRDSEEVQAFLEEKNSVSVCRGHECELAFKDRAHLSDYIRQNLGHVVRFSLLLEMDAALFRADTYLNAVSPTPIHSFLTANYRARASSKVWRKRSVNRRPRSASDGNHLHLTGHKKLDLERTFNRVMDRERERRELEKPSRRSSQRQSLNEFMEEEKSREREMEKKEEQKEEVEEKVPETDDPATESGTAACNNSSCHLLVPTFGGQRLSEPHLFKKLLVACCESCERRASLIPMSMSTSGTEAAETAKDGGAKSGEAQTAEEEEETEAEEEEDGEEEEGEEEDNGEEEKTFECDEENKAEVHDTLANMYFNKVVLPDMEYVEDFVDFLIDAELSDLPVLKRACERYLCGELNTKKELITSLILDLFFIAMVFQLPVMKSMVLTELCERYSELEDVDSLLEQEEYRNLDRRIRQLCGDRTLNHLLDECKRFREQCLRVQCVDLKSSLPSTPTTAAAVENGKNGLMVNGNGKLHPKN